jgi:DNA processing protein
MQEDLRYWLALLHAPGLGPVGFGQLLQQFGDPAAVFLKPRGDLGPLREYLRQPDWEAVERDLAWADGALRRIVTLADPDYPSKLSEIPSAPPVLFVQGDVALLSSAQIAMVGSRNPTRSGAETAYEFARSLAASGLTVTSGLALGVDAASHQGALDGGGHTIAVAGTGLDRVYPARHRALAHAIVDRGGAIVSEFAPGTPPLPAHFPRRNRIISGLSTGTLVVEAAVSSGSLITARAAADQGREVFAIPGSIHNPLARGCHRLIRDGAKLVETAQDVLEELAPQLRALLAALPAAITQGAPELDADQRCLLKSLDFAPVSVDVLVERSGLTAETVSSILLVLELQGYVASEPGGHYARTSKRV